MVDKIKVLGKEYVNCNVQSNMFMRQYMAVQLPCIYRHVLGDIHDHKTYLSNLICMVMGFLWTLADNIMNSRFPWYCHIYPHTRLPDLWTEKPRNILSMYVYVLWSSWFYRRIYVQPGRHGAQVSTLLLNQCWWCRKSKLV